MTHDPQNALRRTPEWARHAIWYQIMIDRFRDGDPANNPPHARKWTSDWFEPTELEASLAPEFYQYVFGRFYGGDLTGLSQSLDYLIDLGVNAIYLNPVFQASTHHKYNATNFLHVDEYFGRRRDYDEIVATEDLLDPSTWKWTEADLQFRAFLQEAHARGLHVIIDGVFNHVGLAHPALKDVIKHGQASRFADWFDMVSWDPVDWHGWAGHRDLPALRKDANGIASATAKQHIFDVTRRWMDPDNDGDPSDGVDGWRLDVPSEIAMPFWAEWADHVKAINPQAYTTGEIWHRADAWLDGRHFDAVMNYEFARPVVDWLCNQKHRCSTMHLVERLATVRGAYHPAHHAVVQNLVDSHDTARFASMAINPDRDYERGHRAQEHPNYNHGKPGAAAYARLRLAALLQMTYVGAPMIYYGDEVGMWGADDPSNRKPMLWRDLEPYEKPNENFVMTEHLSAYKEMIALRSRHPALRSDHFETLLVKDASDVWAFHRWDETDQLIVVLNGSEYVRDAELPMREDLRRDWRVVFGPRDALNVSDEEIEVRVAALGGVVIAAPR